MLQCVELIENTVARTLIDTVGNTEDETCRLEGVCMCKSMGVRIVVLRRP